jgi:hypothetical protein
MVHALACSQWRGALAGRGQRRPFALRGASCAAAVAALVLAVTAGPAPADVGYRGFTYVGTSSPTGDKPQSKLWFNDGIWWGSLFNSFTGRFEIYRLDMATQTWSTTGTVIEERNNAGVDAAWSGGRLHVAAAGPSPTSSLDSVRVRRYSYSSATKTYTLDAGYPETVSTGGVENVTIDRDSTGTVWVTYTQARRVYVARSTGSGANWEPPYVLPVAGADTLTDDDISAIVAYSGQIGVMWSNQADSTVYFASHRDGDSDDVWSVGAAVSQPEYADDHINLKALDADPSGRVFAATKTSLNAMEAPLILLLVLDDNGNWQRHTFGRVVDNHTRAQVAIDREHRQLYMFATAPCCNGGAIYYKQTSLDRIHFANGLGTPFIESTTDTHISNVSTTKQALTSATGLVAIAGDDETQTYFHNVIDLSAADATPPDTVIESGPEEAANTPSATFTFSATEDGATFDCSLDGAAFVACPSPMSYFDLQNGPHTVRVRAADAADNVDPTPAERTWTVTDTTTTLTIPPAADTYAREASPTTTSGTATTVQTDGGSGVREEGYFRFNVSGVAHSVESAKLRVYVTNGSTNGPAIYATGSSWAETALTWNNRPAAVGAPSDDKGSVSSGWTTYNVTPLVRADGSHSFVTKQTSTDGLDVNSREYTARPPRLELQVDPAPETRISSGPTGVVESTSAAFELSSSQPGSTFECSLDGSPYASCSSPAEHAALADGSHTFSVRATNTSGKTDPTPATRTWTVDTVAPAPPTIDLSPDHDTGRSASDRITRDSTPHVMGMADPGGLVTVYDAGALLGSTAVDAAGEWEFQPEELSDGDHTITAVAADAAGNESASSEPVLIHIDMQAPPAPTMAQPADGSLTRNPSVTTAGTAEPDAAVEIFDGTQSKGQVIAGAAGDWTLDVTLADGARTLTAAATDVAGNTSAKSTARVVTVDTAAPETSIESGPNNPTSRTTASFAFSSSESPSSFECRLDDEDFTPCESPRSYGPVAPGTHTFHVRATDAAGNVDATAATWTWTVDLALPRAPVLTAPEDGSYSALTTVTVAGTAEPGVTVEVFDAGAAAETTTADANGDWSVAVSGLVDGEHSFTAKATNAAGFTSGPSAARTVTVDTVAPDTSIDGGPQGLSADRTATIAFSSNESGVTFECRLDGGAFAACSSPHVVTGLSDGVHTIEVRAVDRAGNNDAAPATRTWTVDATPPETTILTGPAGVVASTSATFEFRSDEPDASFQCRLDGSSFAACSSPHQVTGLAPGSHTFEARAIDAAGNVDPTPAGRTWTTEAVVFNDDFETGNFSRWSLVEAGADGTAAVQSTVVRSGVFAARLSATANTGSYAIARRTFTPQRDITVSGDVQVQAEGASGGNVPIFRLFDGNLTRIINLRRQNLNGDRIWIEYGGVNTSTSGRLALNTWARFDLHVIAAGAGADTVELFLNGVLVFRTTTATLGAAGIGTVQIGNETRKQAFALVADNIEVRAR